MDAEEASWPRFGDCNLSESNGIRSLLLWVRLLPVSEDNHLAQYERELA